MLEHRASIPAWGYLPRTGWKEQIMAYPINESETLYSDYSALRVMLEIEKKSNASYKDLIKGFWDSEVCFWQDLENPEASPSTGMRAGLPIRGVVHDPNAFNLNTFCSHAGLFGTVEGVGKTLLHLNQKLDLLKKIEGLLIKGHDHRFIRGWDRAEDLQHTFAGMGCSERTFGHLGFTGTSIWVDPTIGIGHVLLTNATLHHWYNKQTLNQFRKDIGSLVWQNFGK